MREKNHPSQTSQISQKELMVKQIRNLKDQNKTKNSLEAKTEFIKCFMDQYEILTLFLLRQQS